MADDDFWRTVREHASEGARTTRCFFICLAVVAVAVCVGMAIRRLGGL